jgi:PAS domain S-box-containing protein/diguanylate cyclase (GGDEF)-like protein
MIGAGGWVNNMAGTFEHQSPAIDPMRLNVLHGYSLLDPEYQPALARATRVLASALGAPVSFVGVVNRRRVYLTATCGIAPLDLEQDPGLCITTISGDGIHVVPDTLSDPITAGHPLVTGPARIRFYAGIPLTTSDGFNLGTLCVAGPEARHLAPAELALLRDVARLLVRDLESGIARHAEDEVFRLSAILDVLPVAHFTCRLDGTILNWSRSAENAFGYESHQIIGQHVSILAPARGAGECARVLARVAARQEVTWFDTVRVNRRGESIETQDAVYPIANRSGDTVGAAWISRDVSELKRLESLVWESRERFEAVLESVHDAVVMTDIAGNVEYLNPPAQMLTGWTTASARGKTAREVVDLVHEESRERSEHPVQVCLRDGSRVGPSRHSLLVHRDGQTFHVEDLVTPVRHRDGTVIGTVMIFRDTGPSGIRPETSAYLGNVDILTGLPDRRELENQIERALVTAARDNVEHALLLVSIPLYTAVQVRQGQAAANELLKQVVVLLRTQIREADVLARLEDDRLAILLTHCPSAKAQRIIEHLQRVVGDYTFLWEDRSSRVALRVHLLPVHADIRNSSSLLDLSEPVLDLMSLRSDLQRRGIRQMDGQSVEPIRRLDAEQTLENAFTEDRFRLYAQQIMPLTPVDDADRLYEFLVHMLDDEGKPLSPAVFIGAAARDHLANDLDRWVVHAALTNLKDHSVDPSAVWMINLSLSSLEDETFAAFVANQLEESGVLAQSVCFELSESIAIANLACVMRFIAEVKQLGCSISLSQFGTSLHTFSYLRNLDVDYLKIDGSVIRDIADDPVDRAVVGAIGHIAHVMGIQTVAEHVEDVAVLECLKELGIDYAQGYAVARPLPLSIVT